MNRLFMIGGLAALAALAGCGESVDQYNAHVETDALTNDAAVIDTSPDSMTTSDSGLPGDGAMALDNAAAAATGDNASVDANANAPMNVPPPAP